MPAQPETTLSVPFSPPLAGHQRKSPSITELEFSPSALSDDDFDIFNAARDMAGGGSPTPFIKEEIDEQPFNMNSSQRFNQNQQQQFNMAHQQHQQQQQQQQQQSPMNGFDNTQGGSINPSELSMQNSNFMQQSYPNFGSQQNLTYNTGNSGIGDDELLDLGDLNDQGPQQQPQGFQAGSYGFGAQQNMPAERGAQEMFSGSSHQGSVAMAQSNQMFSHTPDGAPIQSPFINPGFHYEGFRPQQAQAQQFPHPLETPSSYNASPHPASGSHSGSYERGFTNGGNPKGRVQGLERQGSHSRSPLTPKTPGMGLGGMHLGTPESGSFPTQPIHTHNLAQHRHQKSLSNQWDSTPGSLHSYMDSPVSSPGNPSHHAQISEVFKSGKHASLPTKVDNVPHGAGGSAPAFQSQEAKRRRRRESHNMVERRRRDNINERIQELSHLVPQHRLEDEKIRKHLVSSSPLSPTAGGPSGISPPQATSLLAGGSGKRAAGNITTGIPIEDKDKGPNKGDILNGSVSWTRDLMWALYSKMQQESEIADYITTLGGTWPFEQTEEEKRMRTELLDAMENNDASSFSYSRGPGSGLRVPKHTNLAGDPSTGHSSGSHTGISPQSLSPANPAGVDMAGQAHVQSQFWGAQPGGGDSANGSVAFKEEDEYGMDIGD